MPPSFNERQTRYFKTWQKATGLQRRVAFWPLRLGLCERNPKTGILVEQKQVQRLLLIHTGNDSQGQEHQMQMLQICRDLCLDHQSKGQRKGNDIIIINYN